ncbi:RIP metalloprotease RseP [Evansella cellulosilytica]|uniref:Zinc metalloprotease n=1 Tax=Evansella cellulosilytica (strain ATCC 21833 / DSM 2522 / FERM P-1141 / JCM 9156 / N-4) TaxID=649639 RepID=E6TSS8_EVAC2|nr:RIP metalloprotease RseP [Evansella cellulosilytica]ADU30720.1 membrane-associated zinc metalloprotease [Evansella cellulosilytica DSM 2522]
MNTFISIIVIFGLLVFIHEFGHLIFAKRAGILCREFAIGFGPKIFSFKRSETVYTIRLLPLGGFVRMAGEDPEMIQIKPGYEIGLLFNNQGKVRQLIINNKSKHPDCKVIQVEKIDLEDKLFVSGYIDDQEDLITYSIDDKAEFIYDEQATQIAPLDRQFGSKTKSQRAMALFAGPMMNFLLAIVILAMYAWLAGTPVNESVVGDVIEDGAAIEAGLEKGDEVLAIDGQQVETWQEMTAIIQSNPNEPLDFLVQRGTNQFEVTITPDERVGPDEQVQGVVGIYQQTEKSLIGAVAFGFTQTYEFTKLIFESLGMLITGQFSLDHLAGPVGIYSYTDEVATLGFLMLMQWTAILSVNLGIINLLPLPALDGGRLLFIGLEALRGKPIDPQKEGLVHFIGFALLMLLMLVVTWNDINKFFL